MNVRKQVSKFLVVFLSVCLGLILITTVTHSENDERTVRISGNQFEPGDVISADMFNELVKSIRDINSVVTLNDLAGTWSCVKYHAGDAGSINPNYQQVKPGSLFYKGNLTLTFHDNGDGTGSWTSTPFSAVITPNLDNCNVTNGTIEVFNDRFETTAPRCGNLGQIDQIAILVSKISETKIKIKQNWFGSETPNLICDKTTIPPLDPKKLSATSAGLTITLTWMDNSTDEIGFKVQRKSKLDDGFSQIASVSANTTTYQDTVTKTGTYWYRVQATNSNGNSKGSNVVRITIS